MKLIELRLVIFVLKIHHRRLRVFTCNPIAIHLRSSNVVIIFKEVYCRVRRMRLFSKIIYDNYSIAHRLLENRKSSILVFSGNTR